MSKILPLTTISIYDVIKDNLDKALEMFIDKGVSFVDSSEKSHVMIYIDGNINPYSILVETEVLSKNDADICEMVIKPELLLIVLKEI